MKLVWAFVNGPKRTVEHVFMLRCGFPEAAVRRQSQHS